MNMDVVQENTQNIPETEPAFFEFRSTEQGFSLVGSQKDLPKSIKIPSKYWGQPITKISYKEIVENHVKRLVGAFQYRGVTTVIIPDSVSIIDSYTFLSCENLKNIIIPNSVTEIGASVFEGCKSLSNITISNSVTEINVATFKSCESLKNITIPCSVTKIGRQAFKDCKSLISITIPDSVTEIGDAAFEGCTNLTIHTPRGSYAEQYANEKYYNIIKVTHILES